MVKTNKEKYICQQQTICKQGVLNTIMNYKNMAGMRICESLATTTSPNLEINNNNYGHLNIIHCVQ